MKIISGIPPLLSLSFLFLVAIMYSLLVMGITFAINKIPNASKMPVYLIRGILGAFLLITGLMAMQGWFLAWDTIPPRIAMAIVPGFVMLITLAFHPVVRPWLKETPQSWLIFPQAFRIIVEFQLHSLSDYPVLPKLMTWEGANFDIVTGVTALFVGAYVRKAEKAGNAAKTKKLVIAWNIMGLLLLTNVVTRGLLSAPTFMRLIVVEPPNTAIGYFPFVWLPCFLVPFAYLFHIWSLRKARQT